MHRGLGLAVGLSAGACLFVQCLCLAAPASRKSPGKSPEIEKAVADLKREYTAAVKNPEASPLREACDYFKEDVAAKLPLDALLLALEKPMPGDARQMAYVKWQLLSGLPVELDAPTVTRLTKLYLKAPPPAPRYGMSKQEQKQLDGMIPAARAQDDVRLNEGLDQTAAKAAAADRPVIAYRDELYRRLPQGKDKFLAAFQDASARIAAAASKDKLAEALQNDLPGWALQSTTPRAEVREVTELLGKLRFVESPPYYAYASVRSGQLGWRTRTDTLLTKKKFADLHKALLDAAAGSDAADAPEAKQDAKANGKNPKDKKAG
jgi:hypothetical protein